MGKEVRITMTDIQISYFMDYANKEIEKHNDIIKASMEAKDNLIEVIQIIENACASQKLNSEPNAQASVATGDDSSTDDGNQRTETKICDCKNK